MAEQKIAAAVSPGTAVGRHWRAESENLALLRKGGLLSKHGLLGAAAGLRDTHSGVHPHGVVWRRLEARFLRRPDRCQESLVRPLEDRLPLGPHKPRRKVAFEGGFLARFSTVLLERRSG